MQVSPDDELRTLPMPCFDGIPASAALNHLRSYDDAKTRGRPHDHRCPSFIIAARIHLVVFYVIKSCLDPSEDHSASNAKGISLSIPISINDYVGQTSFKDSNPRSFVEAMYLTRSVAVIERFFSACVDRCRPPSHESLDLYILASVRLVVKLCGLFESDGPGDDDWLRMCKRHYNDSEIDETELEILRILDFRISFVEHEPGMCEWISVLLGCAQCLIKRPEEPSIDFKQTIEARCWRLIVASCYDYNLRSCPPRILSSVIIKVAIEIETGSVILQPFVKRVMQLSGVSFDECENIKTQIVALVRSSSRR